MRSVVLIVDEQEWTKHRTLGDTSGEGNDAEGATVDADDQVVGDEMGFEFRDDITSQCSYHKVGHAEAWIQGCSGCLWVCGSAGDTGKS